MVVLYFGMWLVAAVLVFVVLRYHVYPYMKYKLTMWLLEKLLREFASEITNPEESIKFTALANNIHQLRIEAKL